MSTINTRTALLRDIDKGSMRSALAERTCTTNEVNVLIPPRSTRDSFPGGEFVQHLYSRPLSTKAERVTHLVKKFNVDYVLQDVKMNA